MAVTGLGDDAQVRAMVALLEAQHAQILTLRGTVRNLQSRVALRETLDEVVTDETRHALAELRVLLTQIAESAPAGSGTQALSDQACKQAELLGMRLSEVLITGGSTPVLVRREHLRQVSFPEVIGRALAGVPGIDPARVRIAAPEDLELSTAPVRLAAVLGILLDNAARHGGPGTITCAASVDRGDVFLRVVDEGPGLGVGDAEALFASGDAVLGGEGSGVGLYLARMVARSLGGDVTLANGPRRGAVATVSLPQRRAGDPRSPRGTRGW